MVAIFPAVGYFMNFLTSPEFQERQKWVEVLIKNVKWIHHDLWTSVRIPAGILIVYMLEIGIHPAIVFASFLMFALTDWFDGKVYRMRNGIFGMSFKEVALESSKFGSFLDGLADKCFVLPVIWYLGTCFSSWYVFLLLCVIEGGGSILIWALKKIGYIKRDGNIYEHLYVGKLKFGLQVFLVCILWTAVFINPEWIWWKLWVNIILGLIIMLAYFSIACKIKRENERFIPDFVTFGNFLCGAISIFVAHKDLRMAAALIMVGGVCDALDGILARKFKKNSDYGILADDLADLTTFGLAPAYIVDVYGLGIYPALLFAILTFVRLFKFTLDKFKGKETIENIEGMKSILGKEKTERNYFKGLPCPSAAIFLASFFLWNHELPVPAILVVAVICSVLMVLFNSGWYHFVNAKDLPSKAKVIIGVISVLLFGTGMIGEAITLLSLIYFIFFQKSIANKLWGWEKTAS